jgi:hypothetical protein
MAHVEAGQLGAHEGGRGAVTPREEGDRRRDRHVGLDTKKMGGDVDVRPLRQDH